LAAQRTDGSWPKATASEPLRQRLPVDVIHDVEREAVPFVSDVDRHHVDVRNLGMETGLPKEPLRTSCCRQLRLEDLDCDQAIQPGVSSQKNVRHAAGRDLTVDGVLRGESSTHALQQRGQVRPPAEVRSFWPGSPSRYAALCHFQQLCGPEREDATPVSAMEPHCTRVSVITRSSRSVVSLLYLL